MTKWKDEIRALTADDWELYGSCEDANAAATDLNETLIRRLEKALEWVAAGSMTVKEAAIKVRNKMNETQMKWVAYGAADTEPDWVKVEQINKVLGTNIDRWN